MGAGRTLRLRAHAKVNLCLSVGAAITEGPRAGMHPIASWMAAIGLADEIEVEALGEGGPSRYRVSWADGTPADWSVEDDLAVRAHRLLEREAGRALPVALEVRKRIPAGGGLGGGSSDAAAVLRAVDELFGLGVGVERLRGLSAALGSDVAFFLDEVPIGSPPRPAVVTGVGDEVERTAAVSAALTLFVPGFGCATGAVYRAFDGLVAAGSGTGSVRTEAVRRAAAAGRVDEALLFNDLAAAAEVVTPELGRVRSALAAARGGPVHVSGSGSTLFALGERAWAEATGGLGVRTVATRLA